MHEDTQTLRDSKQNAEDRIREDQNEMRYYSPEHIKPSLLKNIAAGVTSIGIVNSDTLIMVQPSSTAKQLQFITKNKKVYILPIQTDWVPVLLPGENIGWKESKSITIVNRQFGIIQ